MHRIAVLGAVLLICIAAYMTIGAGGAWDFVLPFRGAKLAGLLLVAVSVSTATVLFQTITQNRILTPSIMGFDALYVLILTALVFSLGAQEYVRLPAIISGVLFRAITGFMQRMIDPNEYAVIQISSFARFSRIETDLLVRPVCIAVVHTKINIKRITGSANCSRSIRF